ncbi:Ssrp [Trypoxylus dichotomus]
MEAADLDPVKAFQKEEELKEKYEGKLEIEISGPTCEVLQGNEDRLINRKLTGAGGFIGHSGTPAIGCSFKPAAGYLYLLERGFMYVHKPSIHIRFEEIASINFVRSGGNTRSFDFEIEFKSGTVRTFSSIEKEEYGKLFDFITSKKLHLKNRTNNDKTIRMTLAIRITKLHRARTSKELKLKDRKWMKMTRAVMRISIRIKSRVMWQRNLNAIIAEPVRPKKTKVVAQIRY